MSFFQYKHYSNSQSVDLLNTSYLLASYSSIYQLHDAAFLQKLLNYSDENFSLAEGWRELSPQELGFTEEVVDKNGFYTFASPLTHHQLGGPQVKLLAKFNENNQVSKVAISFAGTNSIVDIPDYFQLNSGEIVANMQPLLQAVQDYVLQQGLTAEDVLVTGYSLGGAYTNMMAKYRDELAGGFFVNADYIAHASPLIFDDGTVFNFGYENDIVFRILGDNDQLLDALKENTFGLNNPDMDYLSTTNNIVLYNDTYASYLWAYPLFSLANPFAWLAHVDGLNSDAIMRIAQSPFYDFMQKGSVVVVSELSSLSRAINWVGYNNTFVEKHDDQVSFIIGSEYNDKLKAGNEASYIFAGDGDDVIKIGNGNDRIDGGEGVDVLWLSGRSDDWQVFRGSDDTVFFSNNNTHQLIQSDNVEQISFSKELLSYERPYQIMQDGIVDNRFKLFENDDIAYQAITEGSGKDDVLFGQVIFAQEGDDYLFSSQDNALLHGGEGRDFLYSEGQSSRLYGAEGNDVLHAVGTGSYLFGGLGDDVFVFDQKGQYVIGDFNKQSNEKDILLFSADLFSQGDWKHYAQQQGKDVKIEYSDFQLTIKNAQLLDVLSSEFLIV